MSSKILHLTSFVITLSLALTFFVISYVNLSESIFFEDHWSILATVIFLLDIILLGYFAFKNIARTKLSGIASLLLLISHILFVALIIYFTVSVNEIGGLIIFSILGPLLFIPIVVLYLIGTVILIVAFLRRNKHLSNISVS